MNKCAIIGALLLAFATPALAAKAGFYIVRGEDQKCKVVDVAPSETETTITRVGKDIYVSQEEAEADLAVVCK